MSLLDDYKNGLNVVFHPEQNKQKMSVGNTLKMYYMFSVIPFIITVVLGIIVFTVLGAFIGSISHTLPTSITSKLPFLSTLTGGAGATVGAGVGAAIVIAFSILYLWIAIPIGILVGGGLYYLLGGVVLKWFKNGYSASVTGVAYSTMTVVGFIWLIAIPILGWIILALLGLYSLWVLWKGMATQQNAKVSQVFIVWLIWAIIAYAISFI